MALGLLGVLLELLDAAAHLSGAATSDRKQVAVARSRARAADRLAPVIERLQRDVEDTLGSEHREVVLEQAAGLETLDIGNRGAKLVGDVQQYFMDTFVDTTWPACPRHPNHPLWCDDGRWWRCERDGVRIARLGELATRRATGA